MRTVEIMGLRAKVLAVVHLDQSEEMVLLESVVILGTVDHLPVGVI